MMISGFQDAYRNRDKLAEGWEKTGKKIFGYFYNYTDLSGNAFSGHLNTADPLGSLPKRHLSFFMRANARGKAELCENIRRNRVEINKREETNCGFQSNGTARGLSEAS